ncbi:MAG: endonuclease III [Bacilli bacterium]|nr:endonuclease III [Bacilli bacterium]
MIGLKMMMNSILEISKGLDTVIPNARCELNYNCDYELLIAIVLSAQTTDKRVNQVTSVLFNKYSDLSALKDAEIGDLENILRPLGSYRKKAQYVSLIAKILVDSYDCKVPKERRILEKMPGVGRKTVSVFLSEFYDYPEFAVDTHVTRVSKRLGLEKENDDVIKIEEKLKRKFKREEWSKRHKQMVLFGRYYCKAINPMCSDCIFFNICKKNKV